MSRIATTIIAACLSLAASGAHAGDATPDSSAKVWEKTSPARKNVLVELFTSDGCDSCPPANKWLSDALKSGDSALIPLSMHVTYWNYLGWKDGFSNVFFDARQEAYARQAINRFSYTPELFLNGREWRGWRSAGRAAIADAASVQAPLSIKLVATQLDASKLSIQTTVQWGRDVAPADRSTARLYLFLYEDDLAERPNAGELKNVVLKHDHVVRDWSVADAAQGGKAVAHDFGIPADSKRGKLGIVAFVQSGDLKTVYQAIDLPLRF